MRTTRMDMDLLFAEHEPRFRASINYEAYSPTPAMDWRFAAIEQLIRHYEDEVRELDAAQPLTTEWWQEVLDVSGLLSYIRLWAGAHRLFPDAPALSWPASAHLKHWLEAHDSELKSDVERGYRTQSRLPPWERSGLYCSNLTDIAYSQSNIWVKAQVARGRVKSVHTAAAISADFGDMLCLLEHSIPGMRHFGLSYALLPFGGLVPDGHQVEVERARYNLARQRFIRQTGGQRSEW